MIETVTAGGVFWNEARRLPHLLDILASHFRHISIVVQQSDDDTLKIAYERLKDVPGSKISVDVHHGSGDPSFPLLLRSVETPWTFIISGDELPSFDLLISMERLDRNVDFGDIDGFWIPFRSTIEGIDFTSEQDAHLRLFKTELGWPEAKLHSRPDAKVNAAWSTGYIRHDRSLDEMVADYLRYLEMGKDDAGWTAHNKLMLHDAVYKVGDVVGIADIMNRPWWPAVLEALVGYTPG